MDKLIVDIRKIRGLGNLISQKSSSDFNCYYSTLSEDTSTIDEETVQVFKLEYGISLLITDLMNNLNTNLIKNMTYAHGEWEYETIHTDNISTRHDLNGVVYNLRYENGAVKFETFNFLTDSAYLPEEDTPLLSQAVTSISINHGIITFDVVGEI